MSIRSQRELQVTQEKLRMLQERYAKLEQESDGDAHVRALTLRSLKALINQLTEEVVRFKSRAKAPATKP